MFVAMAGKSEEFTFWHGALLLEGVAMAIALALTLVPGRAGTRSPIAELFFQQPTVWEKLFVNFVGINVIFLLIVLVIWLFWRFGGQTGKAGSGE